VPQVEIIRLVLPDMVPLAQQRDDLPLGRWNGLWRDRRAHDVIYPSNAFDLSLHDREGHQDDIVEILGLRRLPFGGQYANDPAGDLLHANALADRIVGAKEMVHDGLAEHTDFPGVLHVGGREGGAVG
jgi:hypothetical protein